MIFEIGIVRQLNQAIKEMSKERKGRQTLLIEKHRKPKVKKLRDKRLSDKDIDNMNILLIEARLILGIIV